MMSNYRNILKQIFSERRGRNPRYSLRSFARDLGITPSQLSQVLNGKQHLNSTSVRKIAKKLFDEPLRREAYFQMFILETSGAGEDVLVRAASDFRGEHMSAVDFDSIKELNHWYEVALIELLALKHFVKESEDFAFFLGLSKDQVEKTLDKLEKLGLVRKEDRGFKKVHDRPIHFSGASTPSVRGLHKQFLEKSISALESKASEGFFWCQTMAVSKEQLEELKHALQLVLLGISRGPRKTTGEAAVLYQVDLQIFDLKTDPR